MNYKQLITEHHKNNPTLLLEKGEHIIFTINGSNDPYGPFGRLPNNMESYQYYRAQAIITNYGRILTSTQHMDHSVRHAPFSNDINNVEFGCLIHSHLHKLDMHISPKTQYIMQKILNTYSIPVPKMMAHDTVAHADPRLKHIKWLVTSFKEVHFIIPSSQYTYHPPHGPTLFGKFFDLIKDIETSCGGLVLVQEQNESKIAKSMEINIELRIENEQQHNKIEELTKENERQHNKISELEEINSKLMEQHENNINELEELKRYLSF
jgi:hypothetical protein